MNATFAAGCFWGVQERFRQLPGVTFTRVGYTGGHTQQPSYEEVCRGDTGHAEAVEIAFDANIISYSALLEIFFTLHDPTTLNRQGPDIGSQYRSVIFYHTEAEQAEAKAMIEKLNQSHVFKHPIVTEIVAATDFYEAEEYHQCYLSKKT